MKKTDRFIVSSLLFFFLFCLSYVIAGEFVTATIISFLLTIAISYSFLHLTKRYAKTKKTPIAEIENGLAFMGIAEQTKLFLSSLPENAAVDINETYFFIDGTEKKAVFPNYKFSPCSKDDIAKFYRICQENRIKTCYVLSRQNPRELLLFSNNLPIKFIFIKSKEIRNYLENHNLVSKVIIPRKSPIFKQKKPAKQTFVDIFSNVFAKERAKYFAISGISLAIMSVFTPLKIYYAIFAMITLSFAIVCYIKGNV